MAWAESKQRTRAVERHLEQMGVSEGLLSQFTERLHPRDRLGQWREGFTHHGEDSIDVHYGRGGESVGFSHQIGKRPGKVQPEMRPGYQSRAMQVQHRIATVDETHDPTLAKGHHASYRDGAYEVHEFKDGSDLRVKRNADRKIVHMVAGPGETLDPNGTVPHRAGGPPTAASRAAAMKRRDAYWDYMTSATGEHTPEEMRAFRKSQKAG